MGPRPSAPPTAGGPETHTASSVASQEFVEPRKKIHALVLVSSFHRWSLVPTNSFATAAAVTPERVPALVQENTALRAQVRKMEADLKPILSLQRKIRKPERRLDESSRNR